MRKHKPDIDQATLQKSMDLYDGGFGHAPYSAAIGHVAYGGEFTLNSGPVDPEKWKTGRDNNNTFSAKSGLACMAYMLSPERPESAAMMKLHLSHMKNSYKDMTDGHADAMMGFTWGFAGVLASDDAALKKEISQYYIPWLNMARCAGSDSYVILPGRDYADLAYYRNNIRNYTTSSVAFNYSFATPRLHVQGIGRKPYGAGPAASACCI